MMKEKDEVEAWSIKHLNSIYFEGVGFISEDRIRVKWIFKEEAIK